MNLFTQEFPDGLKAVITNAYIFEAVDVEPGKPINNRLFTEHACWDTGAEVTILSPRIVEALGLKPVSSTKIMGIGGDEKVDVYCIHLGLPNGYLYKNHFVYGSDIDDYDILIGMDIIAQSDFFITWTGLSNRFSFRMPAEGNIE